MNIIDKINSFLDLKKLSSRMVATVVITITAGAAIWALAAFTEPAAGPADSDQDFAQNILGANNANNDFDSSSVAANNDGSIIERLEYIVSNLWSFEDSPSSNQTASGITVTYQVDENATGFGACLHIDTDGNLIEADADASATMPCVALALESGTGDKSVLLQGFVRDDAWNWGTLGGTIYVSTTTGALTQTAPSGTGDQVQIVGIATHADRIWFAPELNLIELN